MIGLGTIVNTAAVIVGSLLGLLLKRGISERIKTAVDTAIGLSCMVMGISGALAGLFRVDGVNITTTDTMIMIFSLIIGAVLGELINIDKGLNNAGDFLSKKLTKGSDTGGFAVGFANAAILFCVGAMAVVGSLEDGLLGNPSTLYAKSVLDFCMAIVFASAYGIGVMLSSVVVLLYQGGITLLASFVSPLLTDASILQMSLVGSVLIMCIGLNIMKVTKIKVANLLPATFIPIIWGIITQFI